MVGGGGGWRGVDHPHPSSVLKCNLKKKRIIPECNICTFRHTVAKAFVLHFIRKLCCNRKRTTILSDCALSARTQRGMVHVSFTHLYEKEEEEEGEGGRGEELLYRIIHLHSYRWARGPAA